MTRDCGECKACCVVFDVPSLAKPAGQKCAHLCPSGCAQYASRPDACRDYRCAWLDGLGEEEHRPDRIGLVLDVQAATGKRGFVRATETMPGASRDPVGKAVLDEIARGGASIVVQSPAGGTAHKF